MDSTVYYIASEQQSLITIFTPPGKVDPVVGTVYRSREEAEADLPDIRANTLKYWKEICAAHGEEYSEDDPEFFPLSEIRVFEVLYTSEPQDRE